MMHRQDSGHSYHYEVPHASSLSHQGGHRTATWHQHDFNGLCVQKVIKQLGGLTWITLWTHKHKQHENKKHTGSLTKTLYAHVCGTGFCS